jgi:hypothetical protein
VVLTGFVHMAQPFLVSGDASGHRTSDHGRPDGEATAHRDRALLYLRR